jgi:hypothetical protein
LLGDALGFRQLRGRRRPGRVFRSIGSPVGATPRATTGVHDSLARAFGFVEQFFEEVSDIVTHRFHHIEDFFEHVANQIRCGNAQIFGDAADVFDEILRDPCVQDALFAAPTVSITAFRAVAGAM